MGFNPVPVLIGCILFFFAMIFTLYAIDSNASVELIPTFENTAFCEAPRFAYSPQGSVIEVSSMSLDCRDTKGAVGEDTCNRMSGCEWVNETVFFFWNTGNQICKGTIDWASLNNGTYSIFNNYCKYQNLSQNEDTCVLYGCTWTERDTSEMESNNSAKSIFKTLGALLTFRYDFGLNNIFDVFFNFLIFYLPLILIIISAYYIFHPIKS